MPGFQGRETARGGISIRAPQFRGGDGTWLPALKLPPLRSATRSLRRSAGQSWRGGASAGSEAAVALHRWTQRRHDTVKKPPQRTWAASLLRWKRDSEPTLDLIWFRGGFIRGAVSVQQRQGRVSGGGAMQHRSRNGSWPRCGSSGAARERTSSTARPISQAGSSPATSCPRDRLLVQDRRRCANRCRRAVPRRDGRGR